MQLKKIIWIICWVLIISGCTKSQVYDQSCSYQIRSECEVIEKFQHAIVKIHNSKTGNVGTGLIVKAIRDRNYIPMKYRTYILTVAEVVKDDPRPRVEFFSNDYHEIARSRLIYTAEDDDYHFKNLVLLLIDDVDISYRVRDNLDYLLRYDSVTEGDRISVIGLTSNRKFVRKSARLSHVDRYNLDLRSREKMNPGSILIKENKIVGMITTLESRHASAISAHYFTKFIRPEYKRNIEDKHECQSCVYSISPEWEVIDKKFQHAIVKINNSKTGNVGTGLIVKATRNKTYILTVANVVKDDPYPIVQFLSNYYHHYKAIARVIYTEDDDYRFKNLLLLMVEDAYISYKIYDNLEDLVAFYDSITEKNRIYVSGFTPHGELVTKIANLSNVDRYSLGLVIFDEMSPGSILLSNNKIVGMTTSINGRDVHANSELSISEFINNFVSWSIRQRLYIDFRVNRPDFEDDIWVKDFSERPSTNMQSTTGLYMRVGTALSAQNIDNLIKNGHFEEALPLAEQILQFNTEELGKEHVITLSSMNNLAVIYQKLGRFDTAYPLLLKVYETRKQQLGEDHVKTLLSMNNLATIHQMMKEFDEALALYKEVYRLRKNKLGKKNYSTLISLHNLANIYREMGNFQEAQPLFEKSLNLHTEVLSEKHPDTLNTMNALVKLYLEQKNSLNQADYLAQKSHKLCLEILPYEHYYTLEALENLAIVYLKQGKTNKAITVFKQFVDRVEALRNRGDLSVENRQAIFKQWINGYFQLSKLYLDRAHFNDAFQTAEKTKSRTLLEEITVKLAAQKTDLSKDEQQKFQEYQNRIFAFNERIAQEQKLEKKLALERDKNLLVRRFANFHRYLIKKYDKYKELNHIEFIDAKKGASLIPKDALFISYLLHDNHLLVFTLDATGNIYAKDLSEIPNLDKTLKTYNELLSKRCAVRYLGGCEGKYALRLNDGSFIVKDEISRQERRLQIEHIDEISRYLGQKLLEPLTKQLADKKHLIISPDGALALIPFEALILDKNPLIATHHVNYVQSLSVLALLKKREQQYLKIKNRGTLLAMGAARYQSPGQTIEPKQCNKSQRSLQYNLETMLSRNLSDSKRYQRAYKALDIVWCNLPATERELTEIKNIFKDKQHLIFTKEQATEAKLQYLNKQGILSRYRYLHFSAHGYLSVDTPALSALVLDQLSKTENTDGFVTASEWPSYNLKSDLMVLSACQTGVGKVIQGEGIMGLPYALYVAGNKNTLLTLWSVLDNSTADFMTSFFKKLQQGKSQIEALTATKREFLNSEKYQRPLYWAPFVLYGI